MARGSATMLIRLYSSKSFLFRTTLNFPSMFSQFFLSASYTCRFYSGFDPPKSLLFQPTKLNDLPFSDNYANLGFNLLKKQSFSSSGQNDKSKSDSDVGDGVELEFNVLKKEPFLSLGENNKSKFDSDLGDGVELECNMLKKEPFSSFAENATSSSDLVVGDGVISEGNSKTSEGFANVAFRDPVEIYKEIKDACKSYKQTREEWDTLNEIFGCFSRSGWASNQALAVYIGSAFFPTAAQKFRSFFLKRCQGDVVKYLVSLGPGNEAERFLFPIFVEYCLEEFPDEIKRFKGMIEYADLTKPHTWFPFARAMKRKIVYHCGPTNSGKTYNALQRFMEAKIGIYCSPLRLLAMEVFDKVNAAGVYCSLLTGQEKKKVPFSNHIACTVEMASTEELYEVAVIDEIQMMADSHRGCAWTRAFLGLKADEIHLCGDPSVLNIVRKICCETGDELVEQRYERFKKLVVEAKTLLGDLRNVRSGDCVVAFSRREIFEVKLAIEKYTKHRCCVIYGALPPETRRMQANLFNDQDNEYDILVASDAVGMGLNLNIRRVVFYTLSKYNGDKIVPVAASQVKQIAGRAGRRGSLYPDGLTTTLHLDDLDYLISCLQKPFDVVTKIGLFPFFEQVELFAGQLPKITFPKLLEKFGESCRMDGSYFLCNHTNIKKVANMLEKVQGISLEDRFNFCFAPVNIRDPKAMYHLLRYASSFAKNLPVGIAMGMPRCSARNDTELLDLETKHQVLSMYLWLSNHFNEETFPYVKKAQDMATDIADLLGQSLLNASWKPESRNAGKPKPQEKKENRNGYERPRSLVMSKENTPGFPPGTAMSSMSEMAVSPTSVISSGHFPFTASEISGMGVDTSALDSAFTSDVANSVGLQLAQDNGEGNSRDSLRSLAQIPWSFSLSDLTADLSNLGDLGALGNYPGSPFLPSDSDILLDSPEQDDIEEFLVDSLPGPPAQSLMTRSLS